MQSIRSYVCYTEEIDPILALRGFASLMVVWFHLLPPYVWFSIYGIDLSFLFFPSGSIAVYIFYFISGYSVGYGFFSNRYTFSLSSLRSFYVNRFLRIAPAYYVCILASIFIFYPHTSISLFDIVRFFTFTANYHYSTLPYQQLLVVISTEMQFYVFAPILVAFVAYIAKRIHPISMGFLILLIGESIRYALFSQKIIGEWGGYSVYVYLNIIGTIDYFLSGIFVSYLVLHRTADIRWLQTRISRALFAIAALSWLLWTNHGTFFQFPGSMPFLYDHLFLVPPFTCIIVGWYILSSSVDHPYKKTVVTLFKLFSRLLHPRTLIYGIGTISYGIYLYHYVIFDLIYLKTGLVQFTIPTFLSRVLIVCSITIVVASASYLGIENTVVLLQKRWGTAKKKSK